jgi:hypothetical protein
MAEGFDFSEDEAEELESMKEALKDADNWENLSTKVITGEINGVTQRVNSFIKKLRHSIEENDYHSTNDACKALWMHDFGPDGWIPSFLVSQKGTFEPYINFTKPDWYSGLSSNAKKAFDTTQYYFNTLIPLKNLFAECAKLLISFSNGGFARAFKIKLIKANFEEAEFDKELYNAFADTISDFNFMMSRDNSILDINADESERFYRQNFDNTSMSLDSYQKGYRTARRKDYEKYMTEHTGLSSLFVQLGDGVFKIEPSLYLSFLIVDSYTQDVCETTDGQTLLNNFGNRCNSIFKQEIAPNTKLLAEDSCLKMVDAITRMLDVVGDYCFTGSQEFERFKKAGSNAPYCFMKYPSGLEKNAGKFGFSPNTSDPWSGRSHYSDNLEAMAEALTIQCYHFAVESGHQGGN